MQFYKQGFSPRLFFRNRLVSLPTVLFLAVSGACLFFLVVRFDVAPAEIWHNLKTSNPWLFVLAFFLHYSTFAFRGARWRLLLRNVDQDKKDPGSVQYFAGLILVSWFVNSVTFMRLGDAYRAFTFSRESPRPLSQVFGTVLAERITDIFILFTMLMVAALLLLATGIDTPWYLVALAAIIPILLLAALGVMVFVRSRLLQRLPGPFGQAYLQFHQGALRSYGNLPFFLLLGALGWFAEVARLFFVAEALGFPIGLPLAIFATLANTLLTLLPLGGLGVTEFSVAALLTRTLVKSAAGSVVVLDRAISYVSIILLGGLFFLIRTVALRRKTARNAIVLSESP